MNTRRAWWATVVILLLLSGLPGAATAQEENQAGLVIQFGDGQSETWCIPFEGETISGDELLARSELEILIDPSSGMGITVCRIEELGCDYPAEHCFCQCMGGESCAYWNYFYRDPGDEVWTYSPLGALLRDVPPGGMEAWVWGNGHTPPPVALTFDSLCAPAMPTDEVTVPAPLIETAMPVMTKPPQSTATPETSTGTATQVSIVTASHTPAPPQPTATFPPPALTPLQTTDAQDGEQPSSGSYWAFGVIVLVLVAVGAGVLLRQRGGRRG